MRDKKAATQWRVAAGGGDKIDINQAITQGATETVNVNKGDWLDGDAGEDALIGTATSDMLMGGAGDDIMVGGGRLLTCDKSQFSAANNNEWRMVV